MDFARSLASWFSLPRPFNGNILPSRQQSGNEQSICCLIKDRPFSEVINVQIPDSHYISDLKLLVKEGASSSSLQGVNTDDLVIYNVSIANRDNTSLDKLYQRINKGDVSVSIADSMATIGSVFPRRDPGHVHVVVGFPDKPGKLLARPSLVHSHIYASWMLIRGFVLSSVEFRAGPQGTMGKSCRVLWHPKFYHRGSSTTVLPGARV